MKDKAGLRRYYDLPREDRRRLEEIIKRILALTQGKQIEADWRRQITRLQERLNRPGPAPTKEERLIAYQAVRDAGVIPEEAAFFLIAYTVEWLVEERIMADFHHRVAEAAQSNDLQELARLNAEEKNLCHKMTIEIFHYFGEDRMADLFAGDRAEYERIKEIGRKYFIEEKSDGYNQ